MAIYGPITASEASAIQDPKHVWANGSAYWVFTGTDIPPSGSTGGAGDYVLDQRLADLAGRIYYPSGDTSGATDSANIQSLLSQYNTVYLKPGARYYGNITVGNGQFLLIDGMRRARWTGTDKTKPAISRTGISGVQGLEIDVQGFTSADGPSVSLGMSFVQSQRTSFTRNCYIHDCSIPLHSDGSWVYSNLFENIEFGRYSQYAIYFNCTGATGNVYVNLYSSNWNNYVAGTKMSIPDYAYVFTGSHDDGVINQLNAEHFRGKGAALFNGCSNFIVNSLHVEGFEPNVNYASLLGIINSNVGVSGATAVYCTLDGSICPNFAIANFVVSGSIQSTLRLDGYKDRNWTVTGAPNKRRFFRSGTTTNLPDPRIWLNGYESPLAGNNDYLPQNGAIEQIVKGI